MLINCSKIAATQWPRAQLDTAQTMYGSVQDLAFPAIDPLTTAGEIVALAQAYAQQIIGLRPSAVHVMGEVTFVYVLVRLLQDQGIPCLASATQRSRSGGLYDFVQFRPYPSFGPA